MRGTYCLNIDTDKKKAYIPDKIKRKFVDLENEAGVRLLKEQNIDIYSVELAYEQELTMFIMKKDKKGVWFAHDKSNDNEKYRLGKSEELNYNKIIEAYEYLNRLNKCMGDKS
ncbi:MAG: hypothetical protein ABII64_00540 [Elusimicrobiota bacterium]